jgi:hypothetical protein
MNMYEATTDFPFDKLKLSMPTAIQGGGGSYFSKLSLNDKVVYVQLPRASSKNGIVKMKRSSYIDVMYEKELNDNLLKWIENLELKCKELVSENKKEWFSNDLDDSDIAGMTNSISRSYKNDAYILIRLLMESSKQVGDIKCQVYNEEKCKIEYETVTTTNELIPLIQIEGLKFTTRRIDIELKVSQLMVFEPEVAPSICLIKNEHKEPNEKITLYEPEEDVDNADISEDNADISEDNADISEDEITPTYELEEVEIEPSKEDFLTLGKKNNESVLNELDVSITDPKPIVLKNQTEVYYEIYKTAKKKANKLKKDAIEAYLEAKEIKTLYMLDDLIDSDNE